MQELARALDRLVGRIQLLLSRERENVADLSHRLRTPVTALRLRVEAVDDSDLRTRLSGDLDSLQATVDEIAFPELYEPRSLVKGKGAAKGNARPPFEPHVRVKVEKLTDGLEVMRETFLRVQAKTEREFERMRFLTAGAAKDAVLAAGAAERAGNEREGEGAD